MDSTATAVLDQIDDPDHPRLQTVLEQAVEEVRAVVAEADAPAVSESVLRRLAYTYYYDWETDDPDYMLLVQDPGRLQPRHLEILQEANPLTDGCSKRDQIQTYRAFAKTWLTRRNSDFTTQFFDTLADYGLIEPADSWPTYVESGRLFDDFYLGDVVKYRANGYGRDVEAVSYEQLLERELQMVDPECIFTFGASAWRTVRHHMDPRPLTDPHIDDSKITAIHGVVHEVETPVQTTVIPLSHMSGQVWWRFPPDEYLARLRWALSMYRPTTADHRS